MATDLNSKAASGSTKLAGADSTGKETYFADVDSTGHLKTLIHGTNAGNPVKVAVDTLGRVIQSPDEETQRFDFFSYVNTGLTAYKTVAIAARTGIKSLIAGGVGNGMCAIGKYAAATEVFMNEGGFENNAAFGTTWVASSPGTGLTGGGFAQSNTQVDTGSFSGRVIYSKSDTNNYVTVKQTFAGLDITGWRYITAKFYHAPPVGAAVVRTISIILTSNGATRTYSLVISSTDTAGWRTVLGEIENPTSVTGTGFDPSNVTSIDLRWVDGTTRAGTIYWDTVKLQGAITNLTRVYCFGNFSVSVAMDPLHTFEIGESLLMIIRNNDTAIREYSMNASGYLI